MFLLTYASLLLTLLCPVYAFSMKIYVSPQKQLIDDGLILSGFIEPLHSFPIKVRSYALVSEIPVRKGQIVKKGDLIAKVDAEGNEEQLGYLRSLQKIQQGELRSALQQLKLIQAEATRQDSLAKRRIATESAAQRAQVDVVDTQIFVQNARSNLQQTEEQLKAMEKMVQEANYYSPTNGVVTNLMIDPSQHFGAILVSEGDMLARIDEPDLYVIKATVLDNQVAKMHIGQKAKIFYEGEVKGIPAILSEIISTRKGSKEGLSFFEASFHFKKSGAILDRGLLGSIELDSDNPKIALTLPWNAIEVLPRTASIWIKRSQGDEKKEVKLGRRGRTRVEVISGVLATDSVQAALW